MVGRESGRSQEKRRDERVAKPVVQLFDHERGQCGYTRQDTLKPEPWEQSKALECNDLANTRVSVKVRASQPLQPKRCRLSPTSADSIFHCSYAEEVRPYAWLRNRHG